MEWMGGAIAKAQEEGLNGNDRRRGFRQREPRSPLSFRCVILYRCK